MTTGVSPSRLRLCAALLMGAGVLGPACGKTAKDPSPARPPVAGATAAAEPVRKLDPRAPDPDGLPARDDLPAARRTVQWVHGAERIVDADEARARGLTVVDLRDSWAPPLFDDAVDAAGKPLINRYRTVFVGLANDRTDGDGQPSPPGQKNYFELFGIPPSLSVLRARFLEDEKRDCSQVDTSKLLAVRAIPSWGTTTEKENFAKQDKRRKKLDQELAARQLPGLDELAAAEPKLAREIAQLRTFDAERAAFVEVEKRMICEGRLDQARHVVGKYDTPLRFAVADFQQENALLDLGEVGRSTLEAMARPIEENNLLALRRVLAERAAHAGRILEDGSVTPPPRRDGTPRAAPTYETMTGARAPVPNLVGAATEATLLRLGIVTADDALAFFHRHPVADFAWLQVAVRFAPLPDYYSEHMDLVAEIDRGDVWYEIPFDKTGKRIPQARRNYPSFKLFVRWHGERVPLVKWRTTIGSWRSEMAVDGHDYLRYKGSDVGKRVWRHIVAAPVWIPPESTPLSGMVKRKLVNGGRQLVTNYDEVGPGYLSAYGLAMAIHVEPRGHADGRTTYFDNGIRVHGSFDYRSLLGRFSHGCHRLYNNLAVRVFSFTLAHRTARVIGPAVLSFRRRFLKDDGVFDMRLPVRGFYFELTPPLPIETLEGNIMGELKKPVEGYVKKPGVEYPTEHPPPAPGGAESKAGGPAGSGDDS